MARRRHITRAHIRSGISRAKMALGRLEKYREAARETMSQVVTAVEVNVTAFGFGWLEGRYGPTDVVGVPIDVGTGAALHILGFTGLLGKDMSRHTHALANGALAYYTGKTGFRIGQEMAADSSSGRRRRVPHQLGAPGQSFADRMRQQQTVNVGGMGYGQ